MAWTNMPTWLPDQVVGATDFNTYLTDNMTYLFSGRGGNTVVRDNGASYSSTSSSFADIDSTNLAITTSIVSGKALILFTGVSIMAAASIQAAFDITVDGTRIGASGNDGLVTLQAGTATHKIPFCIAAVKTGLSVGNHTFKPVWRAILGTIVLYAGNGVSTEDTLPTFSVVEIG